MASISSSNLVDAVLSVERMSFGQREQLAEEVHAQQPHLFCSVLVLQRYGATLEQLEVVLNAQPLAGPGPRFLKNRCKLTFAALARSAKVSFVARPRTGSPGQDRTLVDDWS